MQDAEIKGMKELNAVLTSLAAQLPKERRELDGKLNEIVKNETAVNRAEAMAIKEVQEFADKIADKLEGVG
jgi:chromosomal replication initiation ATPase DnaA